jgi:hypothetical protein
MSSSSSSERYAGYWVLIFDLVLRGKLDLVWQMLLSHPEIISRDDSQEVFELESIFESHPLLSDTKISASTSSAYRTGSAARDKSDEWLEWRQVSPILTPPPPLLSLLDYLSESGQLSLQSPLCSLPNYSRAESDLQCNERAAEGPPHARLRHPERGRLEDRRHLQPPLLSPCHHQKRDHLLH